MRLYEIVFIARQDVSSVQVESMADEFAGIIEADGGAIKKREYWGLRTLVYRIKKNRKGHYVLLNVETAPDTLKEVERIMGLNEDVLRFLSVSIDAVEEGPSIVMQSKSERPDRDDRSDRPSRDRDDRPDRRDRDDRSEKSAPRRDDTPAKDTPAQADTPAQIDAAPKADVAEKTEA